MLNLFNYIVITQGTDICNRDDSAKIKHLRFSQHEPLMDENIQSCAFTVTDLCHIPSI